MKQIYRRRPEQIRELLQQFHQSGLTQGEFAQQHGVTTAAVQYWRRRHGTRAKVPRFIEVHSPVTAGEAPAHHYRLELPGGITLLCAREPSAGLLGELSRQLRTV